MCHSLERLGNVVKIAIIGKDVDGLWREPYIRLSVIPLRFVRSLSYWTNNIFVFILSCIKEKPDVIILDIFSLWLSLPLLILPHNKRPLIIVDNRSPFYNMGDNSVRVKNIFIKIYTQVSYAYTKMFLDGMTVITEYYKDYVCKIYGFSKNKIGVWSSGVDIERFSINGSIANDSDFVDKFIVIQHGEISYNRGLFETVKAISLIQEESISLLIIGDSIRSNAKNELEEYAGELGVGNRVMVKPPVGHDVISQYIRRSDCAIMAYPNIEYWNNNNPIKLLEYLALGKVVICSDIWTFRNVMKNSKCCCYIKNNDPKNIAAGITYCYENRDKLKTWGREGVEIVSGRFTWGRQAQELLNFIKLLNPKII